MFCAISDPQKDKLVALQATLCSFIICNNKAARACGLLKLIMLYSVTLVEDDAFAPPHKSFGSLWQLLMRPHDEVPLNQLGLRLLDSVEHGVGHDLSVCALLAALPSQLWTIRSTFSA